MYPNGTNQLPPLTQAQFVPGQDQAVRILNGVRTGFIVYNITAQLVIGTADATAILNDGAISSIFSRVVFYENGNPVVQRNARSMARLTELLGFSPSSNVRLGSVAQGTYQLRDMIVIPFAWPLGVNPWETCFVAIDQNAPNTVGLTARAGSWTDVGTVNGNGTLVTPGVSGTGVITNLVVNMVQEFDSDIGIKPLYRPYMQDLQSQSISNAFGSPVTDQAFYIDFPDALRSLMIQQQSSLGDAGDIVLAYQLRTDVDYVDGNGNYLNFADRVQGLVRTFAGAIGAARIFRGASPWVNPAYLLRVFQANGRLSNILQRAGLGANFRIMLNAQQSNTGASGTSVIVAGMDRLQKILGVTQDANVTSNGQVVPS
jgi:hypothetical protein